MRPWSSHQPPTPRARFTTRTPPSSPTRSTNSRNTAAEDGRRTPIVGRPGREGHEEKLAIDGLTTSTGRIAAGTHIEVQVTGRADVPTGATAGLLDLVAVYPGQPGFAALYPCGQLPNAGNVNYTQGGLVVANNAVVELSPTGTVCIYTLACADYVPDITGWTT